MISPNHLLTLSEGQVDVWVAVSDHVSTYKNDSQYESLLAEAELERYRSLQYPETRFDYLLSRALLRTVLAGYLDCSPESLQFDRNEFGKPRLAGEGSPLQFNISLTEGLVLCAVSTDARLGADVEFHAHERSMLEVADQYFSTLEVAELKRLPIAQQRQGFFRYWTLKESLIKARGLGMTVPLDSFSFRVRGETVKLVSYPEGFVDKNELWDFRCFEFGSNYSGAISLSAPIQTVRLMESIPMVGSIAIDDPQTLCSRSTYDALTAAFC
ncbi:MAG: 4'-phosphopantetheinyl transferase [Bermanella sp.]|jgi:4'-phosphopantetheinyl transferase